MPIKNFKNYKIINKFMPENFIEILNSQMQQIETEIKERLEYFYDILFDPQTQIYNILPIIMPELIDNKTMLFKFQDRPLISRQSCLLYPDKNSFALNRIDIMLLTIKESQDERYQTN